MKGLFFACAILSTGIYVSGQDCSASGFYEAGPPPCNDFLAGVKCINLDITDSYDFEGKEMAFIWNLGDGSTAEGLEVKYCYEKGGYYQASLSVIDPITRIEIKDELLVDVYIKGDAKLEIKEIPDVKVGKAFTPDYSLELPKDYIPLNYYWSLGDGRFACDSLPEISYRGVNAFQLLLNVQVVNKTDTLYLCDDVIVNVLPTDPSGGTVEEYLSRLPVEARYLAAPVNFLLMKKAGNTYQVQSDFDNLEQGSDYRLMAYRGNHLLISTDITINGEDANSRKRLLVEEAKNLAEESPLTIGSLIFDLNEVELSKKHKKELKKTIGILNDNPFLKVAIGSYTHTGGSFDRNKRLSLERSNLLRSYLMENGIGGERLEVADPSDQRALINTCVTGANCDYEDKTLNRRTDFKIVGTTL